MATDTHHVSHDDVVKRLKRANGHLLKVISMIEEGRPCGEVGQQMQAIESAIRNAKQIYIRDHIDHCLEDHVKDDKAASVALAELKQISKYL